MESNKIRSEDDMREKLTADNEQSGMDVDKSSTLVSEMNVVDYDGIVSLSESDDMGDLITNLNNCNLSLNLYTANQSTAAAAAAKPNEKMFLAIKYRTSECCSRHCQQRIDNTLLVMHHLSYHNCLYGYFKCYDVTERTNLVLSFDPRLYHMKERQLLGLLAFSDVGEKHIFDNVLRQPYVFIENRAVFAVLLCKTLPYIRPTASNFSYDALEDGATIPDDYADKPLYAIWLITNNEKRKFTVALSLCGRDPAQTTSTIIGVRYVKESANARGANFIIADENLWLLSYKQMQKLTNDFRDELNLEITLTENKLNGSL